MLVSLICLVSMLQKLYSRQMWPRGVSPPPKLPLEGRSSIPGAGSQDYWTETVCPSLLLGQRFHAWRDKQRSLGIAIHPPRPIARKSPPLAPVLGQCIGILPQRKVVRHFTALPEVTKFIWNRVWELHVLGYP